ncbi:type II secretion system GspH family protein [bacterium]|nr:type II secretion system GspH family protein [bacterium]
MKALPKDHKGFSLLELTVVLSIIAGIIAVAGPRLFDKKSDTRKVFREFIIAGKDLKSRAKISGSTYRLAFDLTEKQQSWWVEKSTRAVVIDRDKVQKELEDAKKENKDESKPPPDFQIDTSIFKKKQTLPSGFKFKQIESGSLDLTITDGLAFIHFFSQGLIETAAIQIEDPKGNIWTLVYNPLTGKSDVIPEAKLLKDLAR